MHPRCRSVPLWISNHNHVSLSTCPLPGTLTRTWGPPVQESCLFKSAGTDWHDTWQAGLLFLFFFFFFKDSKQVPWNCFIFHYSQPYESLSSVLQLCPTLCNPTDWSMPGFPVHYQLPEFTQIHVHQLGDAIQPSQPLVIPFLFLPSIFPSVRVFSNESFLHIRWSKYWSFSFSISPSLNIQDWFPLWWTGWIFLLSKGFSRVFSNTTVQKHEFFGAQISL